VGKQELLVVKIMAVGAQLVSFLNEHEPVFIAVIKVAGCTVVFLERSMGAFAAA
jgi:hypothetical protein